MDDLAAVLDAPVRPGAAPGYGPHRDAMMVLCNVVHPPAPGVIAARLALIMTPLNPGEPEFFASLRVAERSVPHAVAFDMLLEKSEPCSVAPVDIMWCFSFYESAKRVARVSIDEARGTHKSIGSGFICLKCGKQTAIIRPIQVNAGDEGNKFEVVCLDPPCREIQIMD